MASLWTLEVNRFDHKDLFFALYRAIHKALPENLVYAIESYESNPYAASHVDLVSTIALQAHFDTMRQVLDEFTKDTDLAYSWSEISGHLDGCAVYCSGDTIEIRPIVPPTETHRPFAGAKQHIYMSATLGEDGDIERSFGVKKIARLPVPEGWDKRGTGRRLVLFPGYGKDDKSAWETAISLLGQVNRSLMLVPDDRTLARRDPRSVTGKTRCCRAHHLPRPRVVPGDYDASHELGNLGRSLREGCCWRSGGSGIRKGREGI